MVTLDVQYNNKAVEKSNRGDHKSAVTWLNRALLACSTNRNLSSIEQKESGDINTLNSPDNHNGANFEFTGEYDEGMSSFSRPIFIPTTGTETLRNNIIKATIFYNIGIMYTRECDDGEALANFQTAQALKGDDSNLSFNIGPDAEGFNFDGPSTMAILHNIGHIEYRAGSLEDSLEKYKNALQIAQSTGSQNYHHSDVACTLNCIGVVRLQMYHDKEECEETLELLTEAQAIYKGLEDSHGTATAMNNLGRVMVVMDKLEEALETYEEVYRIRKENSSSNNLDVAATLFNIGETYHLLGNIDKALEMYLQFLPVASMHLNEDHPDIGCVLKIIADAYGEKQEYERALEYFLRALKCANRGTPPDHGEAASILNRMGNLHYENGHLVEALKCYEQGLEVEQRLYDENDINLLVTMFNIARIHHNQNNLEASLKMYKAGLQIQRNCGENESLNMAGTLSSIGLIHDQMGEVEPTIEAFEEALMIRKKLLGYDSLQVSSTLNSLGLVLFNNNYNEEAVEKFKECLSVRERNKNATGKDIATVLYNIATVYVDMGKVEDAIASFEKCLQLERDGERNSGTISCLKRLGQIYKDTEDFEAAIKVYEEAVGICIGTSSDGANHAEVANIFGLMGNMYLAKSDSTNAAKTIARAIRANRIAELPDHANLNIDKSIVDLISSKLTF
jgi:tetratricopeptide (TPR) repeat protein